jgi:hypothetical protein
MAEQTFRSPGFFEKEIDLSARQATPLGIPAGIIGTSVKGPAFVPVTVGSLADFETRFGSLDPDRFGPYAVREFLKNRTAVTYIRVLGAGANETTTDIETTRTKGTVKNAGFSVAAVAQTDPGTLYKKHKGAVQFLVASHSINEHEQRGYPAFSDNDSFPNTGYTVAAGGCNIVRGVLFTTTGSRFAVLDYDQTWASAHNDPQGSEDDVASQGDLGLGGTTAASHFKLVLSSSSGAEFANDESSGLRIYTASLDPNDQQYIGKILNTDPHKFQSEEHLLYLDFAVESEVAKAIDTNGVAIVSGSASTTTDGGDTTTAFLNLFGKFNTRYTTPTTPMIISQPFGAKEYQLMRFETISDGQWGNNKFKVSIANIRKSSDPNDKFGSFEVQVRRFGDSDIDTEILERYPECNLNPNSDRYIARLIGDKKVTYNFDADDIDERRLLINGKYPNKSARIRVSMHLDVENEEVPAESLPFGFLGIPTIKTNNTLTDSSTQLKAPDGSALGESTPGTNRLAMSGSRQDLSLATIVGSNQTLTGSIVPPLPMRFKITRGNVAKTGYSLGQPGDDERVDGRFYWGVKFERTPVSSSAGNGSTDLAILNTNVSKTANPLVAAYTKFAGIKKLDTVVTGTGADVFNNNKFTLARVALVNVLDSSQHISDVTGTAKEHMLDACYIRNGNPDSSKYTIPDPVQGSNSRITMATLVHSSAVVFNRFTDFNKFSTIFYGGFDGLNILDKDNHLMTDKASSSDTGGLAGETVTGGLGLTSTDDGTMSGKGRKNNVVNAYRVASRIITDPIANNINILAIPGIRDKFVSDYTLDRVKDYGMAIYLMDLVNYGIDSAGSSERLFGDSSLKPNVRETTEQLDSRSIDNNYTATYFPDVWIEDPVNNRNVKVPASIAGLSALAYNDRVSFPWFAPAGFNRGALDFVKNTATRLTSADRDSLYDVRINPIANFPNGGFVIFGQKTLQMAKSALDRVNVRRMLLEVKRLVVGVANRLLFEQNTPATRSRFVAQVTPLLALVQAQAGIEQFRVVCDDTNNSQDDVESNKMNGRIVVVPTRAVEFIAIDFIVTNSGVSFE